MDLLHFAPTDEDLTAASVDGEDTHDVPGDGGDSRHSAGEPPTPATPWRLDKDHGREFRRKLPITAYVGSNGSGKTLCMIHDTLPSLFTGRTIWTTVPLTLPDGTTPDNVHVLSSWSQILHAEHADLLLDEVSAIASSRDSQALPPQVCTMLQQLRKRDLVLRWTAPSWARADRVLRETTQLVTVCQGYIGLPDPESQWRRHVLFRWKSYDSGDYTDFTDSAQIGRKLKPLRSAWYLLSRGLAHDCYDSFAQVATIGTVLDSGRCAVCGGRRRAPECTCADYLALKAAHKV